MKMKNYRLELEINRQKQKVLELQFNTINGQINALEKVKKELIQQYKTILDEGQKLAEENDELAVQHLL